MQTFDDDFPDPDFHNILVSIEYPAKPENYPSIWVDWSPTSGLQTAGIGHVEYGDPQDAGGDERSFMRWRFAGTATFTVVALTSLERDRLADEVIRVLAFGLESGATSEFRNYIENNEFLGLNGNFDEIETTGKAETPGTPWGTEEVVYEITIGLGCVGEFVSDGNGDLVKISEIVTIPFTEIDGDPTEGDGWQ